MLIQYSIMELQIVHWFQAIVEIQ